jgi:hypothetical protein
MHKKRGLNLNFEPGQIKSLQDFANLYGDSFSSKVDLLSKLLGGAHFPSEGAYKERLLQSAIQQFLPQGFRVASGFVLFPKKPTSSDTLECALNKCEFQISKQCDLIVYNSRDFPTVYQDDGISIVRPESVRAIIEVKSSMNVQIARSSLDYFLDFQKKWIEASRFYAQNLGPELPPPSLHLLAWRNRSKARTLVKQGMPVLNAVVNFHKDQIEVQEADNAPKIEGVYVYRSYCIRPLVDANQPNFPDGFYLHDGLSTASKIEMLSDVVIGHLLADVHHAISREVPFNRFFSYMNNEDTKLDMHRRFEFWRLGSENTSI